MRITVITPTRRDSSFLIALGDSLNQHILPSEYNWIIVYNSVSQLFFDEQSEKLSYYFSSNPPRIFYSQDPGKASSVYFATRLLTTDYFLIMNDKDILLANPLEKMELLPLSSSDIGYCFPIKINNSKLYYIEPFSASLIDAYLSRIISGDQLIVYKTSKSLKYFFPPLFNESYLPEDVKHLLAHQDSCTYLFIPLYIFYRKYLVGGLTHNHSAALQSSPFSALLYLYLTLKNITSPTDFRLLRVAAKIIYFQIDTFKRPILTTFFLVLLLPLILVANFWIIFYRSFMAMLK